MGFEVATTKAVDLIYTVVYCAKELEKKRY